MGAPDQRVARAGADEPETYAQNIITANFPLVVLELEVVGLDVLPQRAGHLGAGMLVSAAHEV